MTKNYFWRTVISNAVYVDSNSGDDTNGLGTQQSPYQTLGRAYRGSATKPGTIICRGYFSEDMADGNHSCAIYGEYPGAAIFDGKDTFTIYGFTLYNLIVSNCIPGDGLTTVYTGSSLYAGVGRANAGNVGSAYNAINFPGIAGSNCVFRNCGHYFGQVGGSGNKNVISNPKHNDTYKLFIWGNTNSTNWCIHGVKKEDRTNNKNSTATGNNFFKAIFTDVAFHINDHITFNGCFFGSDCTWWNQATGEQIILEGETSEEKIAFLQAKMAELGAANTNCTLIDCVFLDKTAAEIYNNHELGDFTVRPEVTEIPANVGVFGPALNITIPNSEDLTVGKGVNNAWDPDSAVNNIGVENNEIILKDLDTTSFDESSIHSGLISIDVDKFNVRSLFTEMASKFDKQIVINDKEVAGERYELNTDLPQGKYIVKGSLLYKNMPFTDGDILTIVEDNTQCTESPEDSGEAYLVELVNPNIEVVVFIRMFSTFLDIQESTSHTLEKGRIYTILNAAADVTADTGRVLHKGSIIEGDLVNTISSSENIRLGMLSDSNSDWCPCQTWGNLFVIRDGNAIKKDDEGVPLSSGNANCYTASTNSGAIKSGYNDIPLNSRYQQFKIVARKVC